MPRTRSRTRCCARGAGWRGFEGRSSLRSWLYRIATNSCLRLIERRPKRVLPIDHGPPADPRDRRRRRWRSRSGSSRIRTSGSGSRTASRARGALRAARERRARVHRRAPAPAAAPARGADPARRARLPAARGRRGARHHAPRRSTARCSAPARRSTSGSRSAASRRRCARSATSASVSSSSGSSRRGSAATSTRSSHAHRGRVFAMPPWPTWFRGRDDVGAFLPAARSRPSGAGGSCPTRANGQLALASYLNHGRGPLGGRRA